MRPPVNLSILDVTETAAGVRVTWLDEDDAEQVSELATHYERPDRSCGHYGGYVATGDAPAWVLEFVAAWADAQASGRADDARELRAELRAEAGW